MPLSFTSDDYSELESCDTCCEEPHCRDSIDGGFDAEAMVPASEPSEVVPMLVGATVEQVERELMLQTLARCDGNRTHAARVLGVSVRTMRNKIKQYATSGADVPSHS